MWSEWLYFILWHDDYLNNKKLKIKPYFDKSWKFEIDTFNMQENCLVNEFLWI